MAEPQRPIDERPVTPPTRSRSRRSLRAIAMFARFPRFLPRRDTGLGPDATLLIDESGDPLPLAQACATYPDLAVDLTELQQVVTPLYRDCDAAAQLEQNRHRRQQVLLIVGGLLATSFGALAAVLVDEVWPGIVVFTIAAATAAVASVGRQSAALDGYLTNRLRAEQLRSTYFTYLSAEGPDRHLHLREQATAIRYQELGTAR